MASKVKSWAFWANAGDLKAFRPTVVLEARQGSLRLLTPTPETWRTVRLVFILSGFLALAAIAVIINVPALARGVSSILMVTLAFVSMIPLVVWYSLGPRVVAQKPADTMEIRVLGIGARSGRKQELRVAAPVGEFPLVVMAWPEDLEAALRLARGSTGIGEED